MASQGPHKPTSGYSSGQQPGQAQLRRNDQVNQPSNTQQNQGQDTYYLQETGTHVKNMAQGAAEIGKGAALGAVSVAKGAAIGAANIAHGAADAVKHTFGMDSPATDNASNWSGSNPSNHSPANQTNISNLADTTNYPTNLMDDPAQDTQWPSHSTNPSTTRKNI